MTESNVAARSHSLGRLVPYVWRYRVRLGWALLCSVLASILHVLSIAILNPIIVVLFEQSDVESDLTRLFGFLYAWIESGAETSPLITLASACGVYFVIVSCTGAARYAQSCLSNWIGNRVVLDLQHELFDRLNDYHAAYFTRHSSGTILSLFTADIRMIGQSIFSAFSRLLLDPLQILVTLLFLLWLQWQLTVLFLIGVPVLVFTVRFFARKNRKASRDAQDSISRLSAVLQDHFQHIRLVQLFGMGEHQTRKVHHETEVNFRAMMTRVKAVAASSPLNESIGVLGLSSVMLLAGFFIFVQETLVASDFVVYIGGLISMYQPIKRIERTIQEMQHGLASADRVFEAIDADATLPGHASPEAVSFNQGITFENVSFSYDGQTRVLQDVSLHIRKGTRVALVGPSGAGKTTLVNLVPRFFDPTAGMVCLDENDIRTLSVSALRQQIAWVPQDHAIFADTIRNNLTGGDPSITREVLESAARAAFAHDFILETPDGYDTMLGEHGVSLSGGQAQRIAIARALVRNAPILILDEATSSLDSESEQRIKQSLETLMQGRTVLVIAHRLSTILQSDSIVVMDQGRIVDQGRHEELLSRCLLYQRLYEIQYAVDDSSSGEALDS